REEDPGVPQPEADDVLLSAVPPDVPAEEAGGVQGGAGGGPSDLRERERQRGAEEPLPRPPREEKRQAKAGRHHHREAVAVDEGQQARDRSRPGQPAAPPRLPFRRRGRL